MDLDPFALLLKESIGLDAHAIAAAAIQRAVRARVKACGTRNHAEYLAGVRASAAELQELIEEVVVPETWFFRDRAAFQALTQLVTTGPFRSRRPLRLLSAPCSTGEEPYSMAMALTDAGLTPEQFSIDAVDISARSLAQARQGIFGRNSFRGTALDFRQRHFELDDSGYRVRASAQSRVTFAQANLLERFPHRHQYEVIFCRNLFIYLEVPAQVKVLELLNNLLAESGVLFVGPAESGLLINHGFVPTGWPGTFAFQKAPVRSVPTVAAQPSPAPSRVTAPVRTLSMPERRPIDFTEELRQARELADQAELAGAAARCENLLSMDPECVEALCLLGIVRDAAGEADIARDLYRRALYLDPAHAEALAHLALLSEERGEHESARLLQRRVQRLKLQP